MTVQEVMTERVIWCSPGTNLAAAAALFWENNTGALLVLDDEGKLSGILTDRHICIAVGTRNRRPSELKVEDVMQNKVLTCKATDHIRAAVHLMRRANVRRLPVVSDHGAVEGIVSIDDILMNVQRDYGNVDAISYREMLHSLQSIIRRIDPPESQSAAA